MEDSSEKPAVMLAASHTNPIRIPNILTDIPTLGRTEDFNIREYEYGTILFEQSAERYDRLRIAGDSCLV